MGEYIKNIILAGVVCSVFSMMTPSGEDKSGKYVRYMACIVTLIVIASPISRISSFAANVKDVIQTDAAAEVPEYKPGDNAVVEKSAENISRSIIRICRDKFGLSEEEVTVRLILNEENKENIIIDEVQIYTTTNNKNLRDKIENYFGDLLGCRVFVLGE